MLSQSCSVWGRRPCLVQTNCLSKVPAKTNTQVGRLHGRKVKKAPAAGRKLGGSGT